MSTAMRLRPALLAGALLASLLAACGANGEGAPAESGCPVGNAASSCSASSSVSSSSSTTAQKDPCTTAPTPTPAPPGADDFCMFVAVTNTLQDGLQFGEIKVGTGQTVKTGDKVNVEYTGWLQATGQEFDTSRKPGGSPFPVTLGQNSVIPGWEEGIPGMKVGGKRRLIIPAALGYGAQGFPPTIPGNAVLVFDIEVLSIG